MKKSLYAYFGLLDLHNIDSPGHSLYQIGLVDSLRESFGEEKFDFYSYYPEIYLGIFIRWKDTWLFFDAHAAINLFCAEFLFIDQI